MLRVSAAYTPKDFMYFSESMIDYISKMPLAMRLFLESEYEEIFELFMNARLLISGLIDKTEDILDDYCEFVRGLMDFDVLTIEVEWEFFVFEIAKSRTLPKYVIINVTPKQSMKYQN